MVAKWKSVKPGPYRNEAMSKALRDEMKDWGTEDAIKEFDRVTTGWTGERPLWVQEYRAGGTWIQTLIRPDDPDSKGAKKWLWIDLGTEPHEIVPKKPGGLLVFPSIYLPGSMPGSLTTMPAESSGPLQASKGVMHPGNEPRGWSEILAEILADSYLHRAQIGFEEAARASGHGKE